MDVWSVPGGEPASNGLFSASGALYYPQGAMGLLVVAAWDPELTRFRELTQARVPTATVGVGLIEAAIGTTRCLFEHRPSLVVFLGTCGSLASDLAIGEVVVGASVTLTGTNLPAPMPRELVLGPFAMRAKPVRIATTLGITTDDARAAERAVEAHVEHLEAFAFARACSIAAVPCAIVLGVANPVGSRGRERWLENHVAASARAAEALYDALEPIRTTTTAPKLARS